MTMLHIVRRHPRAFWPLLFTSVILLALGVLFWAA
jgi:hypothetical protein